MFIINAERVDARTRTDCAHFRIRFFFKKNKIIPTKTHIKEMQSQENHIKCVCHLSGQNKIEM